MKRLTKEELFETLGIIVSVIDSGRIMKNDVYSVNNEDIQLTRINIPTKSKVESLEYLSYTAPLFMSDPPNEVDGHFDFDTLYDDVKEMEIPELVSYIVDEVTLAVQKRREDLK